MLVVARSAMNLAPDHVRVESTVRERLLHDRLFFLANCLYTGGKRHVAFGETDAIEPGPDPMRIESRRPISVSQEIPSYTWREIKDGSSLVEEPAKDSEDHGCDACRYAMVFLDATDWSPPDVAVTYEPGTYGHFFGHAEVFDACHDY